MANEKMAACMTLSGTPALTCSVDIHSKVQLQNKVEVAELDSRQSDGSLMRTGVALIRKSSPVVAFTTHEATVATLNHADRTAYTAFVVTQPAVGLSGANTKLVCTFGAGVLVKGDLVGGDAPNTEGEQGFTFYSTSGPGTWAEAA